MFRNLLLRYALPGAASLLLLLTHSGCASREDIEDAAVEAILHDLFMAQGMVGQAESLRQKQADSALEVYAPILEGHGYTMEKLDSMLSVYSQQPKRLDAILDRAIARIEEEKEILVKLEAKANSPQDTTFCWREGWGWIKQLEGIDDTSVCCELPNH